MTDRLPQIIDARGRYRAAGDTDPSFPPHGDLPPHEPLPNLLTNQPTLTTPHLEPHPHHPTTSGGSASDRGSRSVHLGRAAAAAAVGAIALLAISSQHHQNQPQYSTPSARALIGGSAGSSAGAANLAHIIGAPSHAVGMPIPVGNQPVQPIRIVLDISQHSIPARERRALGEWIQDTQNPLTRIRLEDHGRLSQPLTGRQFATSAPGLTGTRNTLTWLEDGVRQRRAGAFIKIGASGPSQDVVPGIRESEVAVSTKTLRVYRALASDAAHQIMITSQQGYGGTTSP